MPKRVLHWADKTTELMFKIGTEGRTGVPMSTAGELLEAMEDRIFVILPETVQVPDYRPGALATSQRDINQVCGRNMAQGEHVVSKMRVLLALRRFVADAPNPRKLSPETLETIFHNYTVPFTTINLAVRNSLELDHIEAVLHLAKIKHEVFVDTNVEIYGQLPSGRPLEVKTAIATYPIEPSKMIGLTTYLPLWKHDKSVP